jgi:hypothetical protein
MYYDIYSIILVNIISINFTSDSRSNARGVLLVIHMDGNQENKAWSYNSNDNEEIKNSKWMATMET